jgi:hypothetical protein
MKKSRVVKASLLAAAAMMTGCSGRDEPVYLNSMGQCVGPGGRYVDQKVCYGYGGGYYGGHHYLYVPGRSAPYYSSPASPGYVRPWTYSGGGGSLGSGTVRGLFGGSAGYDGGGGE